jgi:hypothetical protein
MKLIVATSLLPVLLGAVPSLGNPNLPSSSSSSIDSSFAYTSFSLDLSDNSWDDEGDDGDDNDGSSDASDLCVSSSLLYDGGCLLSSLAIIGGDIADVNSHSSGKDTTSNNTQSQSTQESDEDEDDEDDDGSSSMLSNSSLKRPKAAVGSSGAGDVVTFDHDGDESKHGEPVLAGTSASGYTRNSRVNQALLLRGGAAARTATAKRISKQQPIHIQRTKQSSATVKKSTTNLGSQAMKLLFTTALVTLIFEAMIGHILEFFKIRMQTSGSGASYANVLRDITASKGIIGLWDGFCPWGVVQAVSKGAVFGMSYSIALSLLKPLVARKVLPVEILYTLAGGVGGGMQGYVLSPTLLLKTRVMTNPIFRERMSLWETTSQSVKIGADIVAAEGVSALMKGSNIFALKRVLDWSSRYYFADLFERIFQKFKKNKKLTVTEKSIASLLGGFASTCFTLPLDVLVAKTQDAKKAGMKVNPFLLFRDELRDVGWSGLQRNYMRGFEARLLHVCLTTLGKSLSKLRI